MMSCSKVVKFGSFLGFLGSTSAGICVPCFPKSRQRALAQVGPELAEDLLTCMSEAMGWSRRLWTFQLHLVGLMGWDGALLVS